MSIQAVAWALEQDFSYVWLPITAADGLPQRSPGPALAVQRPSGLAVSSGELP